MKIYVEINGSIKECPNDVRTYQVIEELSSKYDSFNIISISNNEALEEYKLRLRSAEYPPRYQDRVLIGAFNRSNRLFPINVRNPQNRIPGIFEINDFAIIYYPNKKLESLPMARSKVNILTNEIPKNIIESYAQSRRCGSCEYKPAFNDKTLSTQRYVEVPSDIFISDVASKRK